MSAPWRMNTPNTLTVLRVLLVPVFCVFVSMGVMWAQGAAAAVFLLASLTDMLDGRIARKRGLVTDFGKLMDPIADKLLVTAALVYLTAQGRLDAGMCTVFIAREFVISGFRLVAASRQVVIAAGLLGKFKTVAQMIGVMLSILCLPLGGAGALVDWPWAQALTRVVMWAALALSVASGVEYIVKNIHVIDLSDI